MVARSVSRAVAAGVPCVRVRTGIRGDFADVAAGVRFRQRDGGCAGLTSALLSSTSDGLSRGRLFAALGRNELHGPGRGLLRSVDASVGVVGCAWSACCVDGGVKSELRSPGGPRSRAHRGPHPHRGDVVVAIDIDRPVLERDGVATSPFSAMGSSNRQLSASCDLGPRLGVAVLPRFCDEGAVSEACVVRACSRWPGGTGLY